jgi:acyl-CoA synthetase (NDP forming)
VLTSDLQGVARIARLLNPRSIAIVGATVDELRLAGMVVPLLKQGGFRGELYPVNPKYKEIGGLRCYASLDEIQADVDHCIVIVRQDLVLEILEACARKHIPGASIFSSGYAEAGEGGEAEQQKLVAFADRVTFIGPNCMGFANLADGVIATASPVLTRSKSPGHIALVSQSGGLAFGTIAFFASESRLSFSYMVNTGNSAGISFGDLTEFLLDDEHTHVIFMVIESDSLVADVLDALERARVRKPIVLLKLGRGATGIRMARSHTGSFAGDYRLVRDSAEQLGVVCVDDVDDALNVLQLVEAGFTSEDGDGIAGVSVSGGNVTLFADAIDQSSMSFAEVSEDTLARLREQLPGFISVHNPIDLTTVGYEQPERHRRVIELMLDDPSVKSVVPVLTTTEDYTSVCTFLAEIAAATDKRMAVVWNGGSYDGNSLDLLRNAGIPVMRSARGFVRAMESLRRVRPAAPWNAQPGRAAAGFERQAAGILTEAEALAFLERGGVQVAPWRLCRRGDLLREAADLGYPVVVKANSTDTHISDVGGVIVDLRSEADVLAALSRIEAFPGDQVLITRFLKGVELFASVFRHPRFGLVMTLGTGGQMVEILKDVRFIRLPATPGRIAQLLADTFAGRILAAGYRGASGFADAVASLVALGALAIDAGPQLGQIEINPMIVGAHGAAAVDAAVDLV